MWTLRRQMLLTTFVVVLVATAAMLIAAHRLIQQSLRAEVETTATRSAALLSASLAPLIVARDLGNAQDLLNLLVEGRSFGYLQLEDRNGRLLVRAGQPRLPPAAASGRAPGTEPVDGHYHFVADVALDGRPLGRVRYGLSSAQAEAAEQRLLLQLAALGAVGLAVALALQWPLSRVLTRDLERLAEASDRVAESHEPVTLDEGGNSETARLTQSFNRMSRTLAQRFAALQDSERRLRQANDELEQRVARRTAELAAARDAAERASRAKSEFLSRMSHELRTPLNAILGFVQVLRMRLKPAPAGVDEQLQHVETAGWHLLDLINDVLDLSRIEAGGMVISADAVALAPLTEDCVRMASAALRANAVQLHNGIADADDPVVVADPTRLRQVLVNLISNAAKYNRHGGEVRLAARIDAETVEIDVADTGIGMTEAQLAALFEPFNRLGAEQHGIDGTGIGLVVTQRLVELMGGTLAVRSRPGQGSCFTVRLRRGRRPQTAAAASPGAAPSTAGTARATLLYIEDNPSNLQLLAEVLKLRPGIALLTAADAPAGLALARERQPDLVVVDIALPGMDGYTLCRHLRAMPALSQRPIVALSANAMESDKARGLAAGFDRYFTKPLNVSQFLQWLDEHTTPAT